MPLLTELAHRYGAWTTKMPRCWRWKTAQQRTQFTTLQRTPGACLGFPHLCGLALVIGGDLGENSSLKVALVPTSSKALGS